MQDELIKGGKRAQIGELRTFGGRQYIKTADGWKFHGKGTGTKTKQHIENTKQHSSNHTNEQSSSTKQDVKDKQKSSKQSKSVDDTNRRVKHLYDVQKMFSSPENRHMNNVPDNQKKNFIDGLVRSQGGSKKDVEDIHNHLKSTGKYDEYKNKVNSTLTDDEKKTIKHFVDNGQSNVLDEVAIKNIMKKGVSKQTIDNYIDSLKSTSKSTKTSSSKDNSKNESKPKQNKKVEPLVGEAQKKIIMEYYNYEPNRLGYILGNLTSGRDSKQKQQMRKELSSVLPSHVLDAHFGKQSSTTSSSEKTTKSKSNTTSSSTSTKPSKKELQFDEEMLQGTSGKKMNTRKSIERFLKHSSVSQYVTDDNISGGYIPESQRSDYKDRYRNALSKSKVYSIKNDKGQYVLTYDEQPYTGNGDSYGTMKFDGTPSQIQKALKALSSQFNLQAFAGEWFDGNYKLIVRAVPKR